MADKQSMAQGGEAHLEKRQGKPSPSPSPSPTNLEATSANPVAHASSHLGTTGGPEMVSHACECTHVAERGGRCSRHTLGAGPRAGGQA